MGRNSGFVTADISTTILADPKVGHLWRQVGGEPARMDTAVTVYLATVLASWAAGERLPADQAGPWWEPIDALTDPVEALVKVGLLTRDHRIPESAWESWYGPAHRRREGLRSGGKRGAEARWGGEPEHETVGRPLASPSASHGQPTSQPNGPALATQDGRTGRTETLPSIPSREAIGQAMASPSAAPRPAMSDAERAETIELNRGFLTDPKASEPVRKAAAATLKRLGVEAPPASPPSEDVDFGSAPAEPAADGGEQAAADA